MKVLKSLWQRISGRLQPALSDTLALKAIDKLEAAQQSHISDLRVLIDQSNAREKDLAGMVRMVMEERFYRPVVTRTQAVNRNAGMAIEALSDVAEFDEKADEVTMRQHSDAEREISQRFQQLMQEENDYRAGKGRPPVGSA